MGTILVVDDDAAVRRVVVAALREEGHTVLEAADGLLGLELLRYTECDLVLTDWRMPRMGGDRLLGEVRRLFPATDVIMMTGYGSIESAVAAMKAGAVDYMTKPLDLQDVCDRIAMRLAERAARRGLGTVSPVGPLIRLSQVIGRAHSAAELLDGAMDVLGDSFQPTALRVATVGAPLQANLMVAYRGKAGFVAGWPLPDEAALEALTQAAQPWLFLDGQGQKLPEGALEGAGVLVALAGAPGAALSGAATSGGTVGSLTLYRAAPAAPFTREEARSLVFIGQEMGRALVADAITRHADAARDARRARVSITQALSRVIEAYDAEAYQHSVRLAEATERLARCAGLPEGEAEEVGMAALLHHIGELGFRAIGAEGVAALAGHERDLARLVPSMGGRVLASVDTLAGLAPTVLYQHERVDGSGYPDGLVRGDIPIGARILAVADAYDALVHPQDGGAGAAPAEALLRLREAAGKALDEALVEAWARCVEGEAAAGG